jgi:hypothetical protein
MLVKAEPVERFAEALVYFSTKMNRSLGRGAVHFRVPLYAFHAMSAPHTEPKPDTTATINDRILYSDTRAAGYEPDAPLVGYILCFSPRFHCLASARLLQTKRKSLKYISARGASSFHLAIFVHASQMTPRIVALFARHLAQQGQKSLSENRVGFVSRRPSVCRCTSAAYMK